MFLNIAIQYKHPSVNKLYIFFWFFFLSLSFFSSSFFLP